jgi:uncharacterized membrane protein
LESGGKQKMSELVAVAFEDRYEAQQVLNDLKRLEKEYLIDLEDACVVERDAEGKIKLNQSVDLVTLGTTEGGSWGALWGTLIGSIFLNPLVGLITGSVIGATTGGLSGYLSDYGIDDDFMRSLGNTLKNNTSALFLLIRRATPDKVIEELSGFNGKVLRTSLSKEQEEKLRQALEQDKKEAQKASTA